MCESSTPLLSSPAAVVTKMLEVAEVGPEDVVYDLGCGNGRILIAAVERFNAKEAVGYEIREEVYDKALQDVAKRHLSSRIRVTNDFSMPGWQPIRTYSFQENRSLLRQIEMLSAQYRFSYELENFTVVSFLHEAKPTKPSLWS